MRKCNPPPLPISSYLVPFLENCQGHSLKKEITSYALIFSVNQILLPFVFIYSLEMSLWKYRKGEEEGPKENLLEYKDDLPLYFIYFELQRDRTL